MNYSDSISQALRLQQAGQLTESAAIYEEILTEQPENGDALHLLALVMLELKQPKHAIELLKKAISTHPNTATYFNSLGNALSEAGLMQDAVSAYLKAAQFEPNAADIHYNLGTTYLKLNNLSQAAKFLIHSVAINPANYLTHYNLGLTYHELGKLDLAVESYREAMRLNPNFAECRNNLGLLYHMCQQWKEAVDEYEKALNIKPDYTEVMVNLGNSLKLLDRQTDAMSCYRDALSINPNLPQAHYNIAILLYKQDRYKEAETAFKHAIALKSDYAEAWRSLAHTLRQLGDLNSARTAYEQALKIKPDFADANYSLAGLLRDQGKNDQAEEAYKHCIQLQPEFAEAHFDLAVLLNESGRLKESISCYQNAAATKMNYYEAYYNLALTENQLGHRDKAITAFEQAIAAKPDFAEAHYHLGFLWHGTNYSKSIASYKKAVQAKPDFDDAIFHLGVALEATGDTKKAIEYFQATLRVNPAHRKAQWSSNLSLPILYKHESEIQYWRSHWSEGIKKLRVEAQSTQWANPEEALDFIGFATNFYLHYQGQNDLELQGRYGQMLNEVASLACPQYTNKIAKRTIRTAQKIRVAFIVPHSSVRHTVFKLFEGWMKYLDRSKFEITGVVLISREEDTPSEIESLFDYTVFLGSYSVSKRIEEIHNQAFDVIVYTDIGMLYTVQPLASLRLAPIQCVTWGHPVTSGLPTIDFFLSSELMEPNNGATHYTETLVRLPNLSICYPLNEVFGSQNENITNIPIFLCNQSLYKILPQFDEIIAQISMKLDKAQFWFIEHPLEEINAKFRERLRTAFSKHGLKAETYCKLHPRISERDFIRLICRSTVVLDTLGWSGGNTSLETLSCNKPIVTLPGLMMRSRHTYAMLRHSSLDQLIARDVDDYIKIAVRLVTDKVWYSLIVNKIIQQKASIYNDQKPIRALENFFFKIMNT